MKLTDQISTNDITGLVNRKSQSPLRFAYEDYVNEQVIIASLAEFSGNFEQIKFEQIARSTSKLLAMHLLFPGTVDELVIKLQQRIPKFKNAFGFMLNIPELCMYNLIGVVDSSWLKQWIKSDKVGATNPFQLLEEAFIYRIGLQRSEDPLDSEQHERLYLLAEAALQHGEFESTRKEILLYLQLIYPQIVVQLGKENVVQFLEPIIISMYQTKQWNIFWVFLLTLVLVVNDVSYSSFSNSLQIVYKESESENTLPTDLVL